MKANSKTREYLRFCLDLLRYKPLVTAADFLMNILIFSYGLTEAFLIRQIFNGLETGLKYGFDRGLENGARSGIWREVGIYLVLMVVCSLLRVIWIMVNALLDNMRSYYFQNRTRANMLRLLYKQDDMVNVAGNSGKIFERLDDDIPACHFPPELISEVLGFTVITGMSIALLLSINWQVTLFIFIPMSAAIYGVQRLSERMKEKRKENRAVHDEVSAFIGDVADSVLAIKTSGAEASVLARYDEGNRRRTKAVLRDIFFNAKVRALLTCATSVGTVVMMFIAARMITSGTFGLGDFSIFVASLGTLASCVDRIVELIYESKKAEVSYERIVETVGEENRGALSSDAGVTLKGSAPANDRPNPRVPLERFCAKGLSFSYDGDNGFANVNIDLRPGELIAVAGEVGSGKSALLGVLAGYMKADSGELLWNGKTISGGREFCTPPNIACAPQRSGFFSSDIASNLCLGYPAAPEELAGAIRLAALEAAIAGMNGGLNTLLGKKGERLSGGQRQRLGLARMFVRDAELNIIDDCVSALDEPTQLRFRDHLTEYLKGSRRAAVMATNRTPFLCAADKIYVMKNGRVIAEGQYDELLVHCAEFAAMVI
ncbi:MAG: ABC transporter ATP-binding protein/permease [Clostridiales bacterium]|jgi:ATP-binding cassette subfamily B protein|nr:ABC transporter ATP-binding protein/permease [Clostridiales bacterium]